jgi:hypothetical protein
LYIWDIKTTNKDGVRDLLKASECSDYSSPHGNHWLEGTGNVGTSEIYTQYVKQLEILYITSHQYMHRAVTWLLALPDFQTYQPGPVPSEPVCNRH